MSRIVKWLAHLIKRHSTSSFNSPVSNNRFDIIRYIPGIFKYKMNEKVKSISRMKGGIDCIALFVTTETSEYVIKIPHFKRIGYIHREFHGCTRLKGIVPVPKIYSHSTLYIIEEFIPGLNLNDIVPGLTEEERQEIFMQMGQLLKKIHSVKMNGFGPVGKNGDGIYNTLEEYVNTLTVKSLAYVKTEHLLASEHVKKISEYLNQNSNYCASGQSVLLHFDLGDYNIRMNQGKISGIVDFGDLAAGPHEFDLARPFIHHYSDGIFESILQGYGDIDYKRFQYFTLVFLLQLLPYYHKNDYKEELKNAIHILNETVSSNHGQQSHP